MSNTSYTDWIANIPPRLTDLRCVVTLNKLRLRVSRLVLGVVISAAVACGCVISDGDNELESNSLETSTAIESESDAKAPVEGGVSIDVVEETSSEEFVDVANTTVLEKPVVPRLDNTLYVKADIGCDAADPAYEHGFDTRSANLFTIVPEIHAGLLSHSPDGTEIRLELAEDYAVRDDFTSYEFRLRDGLKFSDGSPLTALDVKWSWERAFLRANGYGRANDVFGSIVGADTMKGTDNTLSGIQVLDDERLAVQLKNPRYDFTSLLADPVASVLKAENVMQWPIEWDNIAGMTESEDQFTAVSMPVGAGPFKLIEYTSQLPAIKCQMVRNEHYWKGPSNLDRIVAVTDFQSYDTSESLIEDQAAFNMELIDYYLERFADSESSQDDEGDILGKPLLATDAPRTWFLIFNPAHPPFDDVAFRRALVAGSDVGEVFPYASADSLRLVPPSVAKTDAEIESIRFDIDAAHTEFAKSEYSQSGDGFNVEFGSDGLARAVLPPLFDQWYEKFGTDIVFVSREVEDGPEIAESHDVEDEPVISEPMRLVLLSPQYPDSHAVLRTFIAPFGEGNSVGELVEVENMIKDAVEESDADTRSLKYAEIEQYIIDQALALPLRIDEYRFEFRVQPWVNGLEFPMYGGSALYSVRMETSTDPQIEKTQRSEIQVQSNSLYTASEGSGDVSTVDPRRGVTGDVLFVDAVDCGIPDPAIDDASELRSSTDFVLVSEIHAGLMEIAPSTNDIVPVLVESYSLGEDGVTYVFNLRKDLKFSDGSPLTAVDVKWSWERALRESTRTSRANDVLGSILGARDVRNSGGDLIGVKVVDELSIKVQLENPRPDFPLLLADPIASVLKRNNVEDWAFTWTQFSSIRRSGRSSNRSELPVGAGPFKLASYDPEHVSTRCSLVRNQHYWGEQSKLDAIVPVTQLYEDFGFIRSKSVYTNAFRNEKIDYYFSSLAYEDGHDHTAHAHEDRPGISVLAVDPPQLILLIFNPAHPPFDDVAFRRAFVAGTDRESLYGHPIVTDGYIVPKSISKFEGSVGDFEFRPDFADQEFARSKYSGKAGDFEVQFNVSGPGNIVEDLIDQWNSRFGLNVNPIGVGVGSPTNGLIDPKSNTIQMIFTTLQYPDPHAVLREFIAPFGDGNSVGELAIVGKMINEASATQDAADRAARYAAIEQYIIDQALAYPIRVDEYHSDMRVQPWVHGLSFPQYGASRYRDVWFDETAPKRQLPGQE